MSVPRGKLTWFTLGAVIAGIAVGLVVRRPTPADDGAGEMRAVDQAAFARQLERIDQRLFAIEQRLPGAMGAKPATDARPTVETPPAAARVAAASIEQQRAAESGGGIVQRAIGAGTLTRQDATEFAAAAAGMRETDRLELRRQLANAINEDRVTVEPGAELML
jgi:hypothetical protein